MMSPPKKVEIIRILLLTHAKTYIASHQPHNRPLPQGCDCLRWRRTIQPDIVKVQCTTGANAINPDNQRRDTLGVHG